MQQFSSCLSVHSSFPRSFRRHPSTYPDMPAKAGIHDQSLVIPRFPVIPAKTGNLPLLRRSDVSHGE